MASILEGRAERLEIAGAARRLRGWESRTLDEAIDHAEAFRYARIAIHPMQLRSEIRALLEFLGREPPARVLEIGTGRGGTLFLLSQVARDDALLVSVDAPGTSGFGSQPEYIDRRRLYESLGRGRQRVVFVAADSHLPETRAHIEHIFAGRPLDLLFIDGDHSATGVDADFRMYSPLVREGGLVAFHDIVRGPHEQVGGVPDFWQRVRTADAIEFVEDWNQGGYGIGVLRR
jgi:predicted O-methyltransferase YrrM